MNDWTIVEGGGLGTRDASGTTRKRKWKLFWEKPPYDSRGRMSTRFYSRSHYNGWTKYS